MEHLLTGIQVPSRHNGSELTQLTLTTMFTFVQRRDDVCSFTVIIILFSNSVKWQDFTFNSADDITKQMYAVDVCAIAKISLPSAVHWAMKFQFWSQICLRPLKLTTFVC